VTEGVVATRDGSLPKANKTMSDEHERIERLHRVLKRLEQVCGQAEDLFRMARELKVEAGHSMRLVRDEVSDRPKRGSPKAGKAKKKRPKRKRR
jgi:hypothetical protein